MLLFKIFLFVFAYLLPLSLLRPLPATCADLTKGHGLWFLVHTCPYALVVFIVQMLTTCF